MALPTASDNQFPKVILEEVTSDGSTTVTPAADHRAMFLGEDGALYLKDSAGSVTSVAGGAVDAADVAFTPTGTISATDVQAAIEEVASEAGGGGATLVRKTAAEIVNGSSTLQDDDDLLLALAANEVWQFDANIWFDSGTTPDIKFAFTVPAGASLKWTLLGNNLSGFVGGSVIDVSGTSEATAGSGVGTARFVHLVGVVANGATPGNLQFQWAQNTSNGSDTTVHANSMLICRQLV